MRRAALILAGAAVAVALSGCLRVDLSIDADGSGRVRLEFPKASLLWAKNRDLEHLFAGVTIAEMSMGVRVVADLTFETLHDLAAMPVWQEFRAAPPVVRRLGDAWQVELPLRTLRDWAMRQRLAGVDDGEPMAHVSVRAATEITNSNAAERSGDSAVWSFSTLDLWQNVAPAVEFAVAAPQSADASPSAERRPNIILFVADDMGQGDVRVYNPASRIPTRAMDRIAAEGIRFDHAYAPSSVCTPTRYSLLTGRHAFRSRLDDAVLRSAYAMPILDRRHETVAGLLTRAGYVTAAFGKWHLGLHWSNRAGDGFPKIARGEHTTKDVDFTRPITDGPLQHGFQSFFGIGSSLNHDPYTFIADDRVAESPTRMRPAKVVGRSAFRPGWVADSWDDSRQGTAISAQAREFIGRHARASGARPFFIYYAATANHAPHVPPRQMHGRPIAGRGGDDRGRPERNDMIVENDVILDLILDSLDDPDGDGDRSDSVADDTLLIVTSDNGADVLDPERLRGMKGMIYEGGHRVPFLARWPRRIAAGGVSDQVISLIDFYATFAALVETQPADGAAEDSVNVLPALVGERFDGGPVLLQKNGLADAFAVRHGPWKLIVRGERPMELYDVIADPRETTNRISGEADVVNRLMGEYARMRRPSEPLPAT